jgi:pimeloyl-ACP methyl ester carboxylesterase
MGSVKGQSSSPDGATTVHHPIPGSSLPPAGACVDPRPHGSLANVAAPVQTLVNDDVPGTPRTVDLGGPVFYEEWEGPGQRTFVLVHGLGGSHLVWRRVGAALAQHGRVLAVDLAGFGRTPRAGRSSAMSANRRLLGTFLDRVAPGPVILAGNSMGGGVALWEAAMEPDQVEGVVCSSSIFPYARGGIPAPVVVAAFALYRTPLVGNWFVRQRFQRLTPEHLVRVGFELTTQHPETIPPSLVADTEDLVRERAGDADAVPAFLEGARSILRLLDRRSYHRQMLDAIRAPVLVIHGHRDKFVPWAFAVAATATRPDWRLALLPDVGHAPQLEAPDRWLGAVEQWLGEVGYPS